MLNIVLLVFNLLPIPPLDGYRVVEDLAPANIRAKMTHIKVWINCVINSCYYTA